MRLEEAYLLRSGTLGRTINEWLMTRRYWLAKRRAEPPSMSAIAGFDGRARTRICSILNRAYRYGKMERRYFLAPSSELCHGGVLLNIIADGCFVIGLAPIARWRDVNQRACHALAILPPSTVVMRCKNSTLADYFRCCCVAPCDGCQHGSRSAP